MATAPRMTRLLDVAFVNEYGQKRIIAHVCTVNQETGEVRRESGYDTARTTGQFSGEALEDFRVTCYVGHAHTGAVYEGEEDKLWGWGYEYKPFVVDSLPKAERIVKAMRAFGKEERRIGDLIGGTPTFPLFLRRVAAIVGATEIRVWIPRAGATTSHLSAPLALAEGADLVASIAADWGRSRYADVGGMVAEWLAPPVQAPTLPSRSPIWLDLRDCAWCSVCLASIPDSEDPDARHPEASPRCYTDEALDGVDRLRAEHAQVRASA